MKPVHTLPGANNRAVHLAPYGYHPWIKKWKYWIKLLKSMRMSWVVILSEGDSVLKYNPEIGKSIVQLFLDNGINPVVRFKQKLDRPWYQGDLVSELVRQFEPYGLNPLVLIGNEAGDDREYVGKKPVTWANDYIRYFLKFGQDTVNRGAVALFADGPSWPWNPFVSLSSAIKNFEDEWMGYANHVYGLNRPPDYPYDSVTQLGHPLLTEKDMLEWFGPFYNDRGMNDVSLKVVNNARVNGKQPGLTAVEDDTCWRGWERTQKWMQDAFGFVGFLCETEGGWTPGAVAGTGTWSEKLARVAARVKMERVAASFLARSGRDLRFLKPTPLQVADWTVVAYNTKTPLRFQGHWTVADSTMGGSGGWDMDAWVTGWYREFGDEFYLELPVIRALQGVPKSKILEEILEVKKLFEEGGKGWI